jgi:hypothetical protein
MKIKKSNQLIRIDPDLWDRLVWQKAFDKAIREKMSKQYKETRVIKNILNQRTH